MKFTVLISCVAILVTQNVPLRAFADFKAEPQISYQVSFPSVGFGRGYEGISGGNIGGALRNAASGVVNTAGLLAGAGIGAVAGSSLARTPVNSTLNRSLQSSGALNGGLGVNGGIGENTRGGLGDLAGGIINTAGSLLGGAAGAVAGAINGVINGALGGALGGAVNTVLGSGVGGIITVDNTGRGCTAKQISGIIKTIFSDMKIYLQECRSNYDCRGIAREKCGVLPEIPKIGSVCLFS